LLASAEGKAPLWRSSLLGFFEAKEAFVEGGGIRKTAVIRAYSAGFPPSVLWGSPLGLLSAIANV